VALELTDFFIERFDCIKNWQNSTKAYQIPRFLRLPPWLPRCNNTSIANHSCANLGGQEKTRIFDSENWIYNDIRIDLSILATVQRIIGCCRFSLAFCIICIDAINTQEISISTFKNTKKLTITSSTPNQFSNFNLRRIRAGIYLRNKIS
jgi:hypothetical protein